MSVEEQAQQVIQTTQLIANKSLTIKFLALQIQNKITLPDKSSIEYSPTQKQQLFQAYQTLKQQLLTLIQSLP